MTRHLNACLKTQRLACRQSPTPSLGERRALLAQLALMTKRHRHAITEAIQADFGQRSDVEIQLADIQPVLEAVRYARRHLWHWMRPWRVSVPWRLLPGRARIAPSRLAWWVLSPPGTTRGALRWYRRWMPSRRATASCSSPASSPAHQCIACPPGDAILQPPDAMRD